MDVENVARVPHLGVDAVNRDQDRSVAYRVGEEARRGQLQARGLEAMSDRAFADRLAVAMQLDAEGPPAMMFVARASGP